MAVLLDFVYINLILVIAFNRNLICFYLISYCCFSPATRTPEDDSLRGADKIIIGVTVAATILVIGAACYIGKAKRKE